jgi:WD40 repeat protein
MREHFKKRFKNIGDSFSKKDHFIRKRLIIYRQILERGEVTTDDSPAQLELLKAGLLIKQQGKLKVYNRLYQEVFTLNWVEKQLVPDNIANEISAWVEDEEILCKKLREIVLTCEERIPDNGEVEWVEELVRSQMIEGWESGNESYHCQWKTICDHLLNQEQSIAILKLYQRILQGEEIAPDDSPLQMELFSSDLVSKGDGILIISKRIYQAVFDKGWVDRALANKPELIIDINQPDNVTQTNDEQISEIGSMPISSGPSRRDTFTFRSWMRKVRRFIQQNYTGTIKFIKFFILGLILIFTAKYFYKSWEIERINQAGLKALQVFESNQLIGLTKAVQSGESLKKLLSPNIPIVDYPTVTPLFALQKILDNIYERNEFSEHDAPVRSISFSPDGEIIASSGEDGSIRLWNLLDNSNKVIDPKKVAQGSVLSMSFSPKEKNIATGGEDGTVRFWNQTGGEIGSPLKAYHQGKITSISFSPNGEFIATSASNKSPVKLWNIQSRQLISQLFPQGQGNFESVSFSPDGQQIITAEQGGIVRLWKWNQQDKDIKILLQDQQGGIRSVNFSPDGAIIATVGKNGTVRLWDLEGKPKSHSLEVGEVGGVLNLSFKPKDGKLMVVAGESGTVQVWKLTTVSNDSTPEIRDFSANLVAKLNGHNNRVYSVKFSPDGNRIATGGMDKFVLLWDLSNLENTPFFRESGNIETLDLGIAADHGVRLAILRKDNTVKLLDILSKDETELEGNPQDIISISLSPDKKRLATLDKEGIVRQWDLSGKQLGNELKTRPSVIAIILGSDKVCVTLEKDGKASLWEFSGIETKLNELEKKVRSVSFSHDGQIIATGAEDSIVKLWEPSGAPIKNKDWNTNSHGVKSVKFSPDGQIIAALGRDEKVKLWNLSENKKIQLEASGITTVGFSPNQNYKLIATGGDKGIVSVWNWRGRQVAEFKGSWDKTVSVSFTPDGKQIVAAGDNGIIQRWDIEGLNSLLDRGCNWLQDYRNTHRKERKIQKICSS